MALGGLIMGIYSVFLKNQNWAFYSCSTLIGNLRPFQLTMLHYEHFSYPNSSHFISQLLEGSASKVRHHWKAIYLSNTCVNSFKHKNINTIVICYIPGLTLHLAWKILFWKSLGRYLKVKTTSKFQNKNQSYMFPDINE